MLKILLITALLGMLTASSDPKVYICNSENAIAYHYAKDCRGIKPCKIDILEAVN